MRLMKFGVGQPHTRVEDPPLLTGHGRYVADAIPTGALRAIVVRSPHAHAHFKITALAAARKMPGVRLILTAADIADFGLQPSQGATFLQPSNEDKVWVPPYPVLPTDIARYGGEPVAFVVADTVDEARDAGEALGIEWEPLPAIADTKGAVADGAPLVWPERKHNLAFTAELGDSRATEAAFAKAAHVVKIELVNQRVVANYIEPRGVVAEIDERGRVVLTLGSQGSHMILHGVGVAVMKLTPDRMRVITNDVGGGFGTKAVPYGEYALAGRAAQKLKKVVAWVSERSEHFIADTHGRDNFTVAEMAVDKDGKFLAIRVDTIAAMGAYLSAVAPYIPYLGASMLPGVYTIPVMHARVRGIYTHTVPVEAYRGAGRPEAAYVIERLVDAVARELKLAPDEIRRRNFISKAEMPYKTASARVYDSGDFAGHLARAQELADWKGFPARAALAKKAGKFAGIGIATYIEACGMTAPESGKVRLETDGTVTVLIGTQSQGHGHKTTYAQLVSEQLDIPLEQIRVLQGDTDLISSGGGTVGSRSMPTGGPVVVNATAKLAYNLKRLAGDELEASVDDLEFADGAVRVVGTNRSVTLAALAKKPGVDPASLVGEEQNLMLQAATYPNGTHICEAEIDPATGAVTVTRYTVVDDFGLTLNPLLLRGQVHGGIVQGIGQALLEGAVYDESGQLLTASFMDYAMPRADDLPNLAFETRNVPCTTNPLGVKGAGEAGTIGSCPATMNAVVDALACGAGIPHIDMPASPERVWRAIAGAKRH
jgi:aerobic carbon-monoxide dehydrogenase large subunit